MPPKRPLAAVLLLGTLVAAGCGSDAVTAEAEPASRPAALDNPLAEIPREELYGASAADNLWSPRVELEVLDLPRGWDGARVAVLADFNLGVWDENADVVAAAVRRAVEAQPDLVVLLGDYLAEGGQPARLRELVAPLGGRRALAVLGERDVRTDSTKALVTAALRSAGVTVLENTAVPVTLGGDTAWVAGVDADLAGSPGGDQNFVLATLGVEGRTPLLLTHLPAFAARAPAGRYPIVLAGNTFCGDVDVPGSQRMSWVRAELFPGGEIEGTGRLFRVRGQTVLLSCGLGYGFVPVRFGAPPEVLILTLRRIGPDEPTEAPAAVEDSVIQRFQQQPTPTPADSL